MAFSDYNATPAENKTVPGSPAIEIGKGIHSPQGHDIQRQAIQKIMADAKTFAENTPSLNADGGATYALTTDPSQIVDSWFGGTALAQHRFFSNTSGKHFAITCTITIASPGVIDTGSTRHNLVEDDAITLRSTGTLPTGLAEDTTYYVIAAGLTLTQCQLSLTPGGAAINTSGSQSGTHTIGIGVDCSRWAMSVTANFTGSGGNSGAAQLDGALYVEAEKLNWRDGHTMGEGIHGPVTTMFIIAANNEWGDTAAIVPNVSKVFGDTIVTNTTGSVLQYEGGTTAYIDEVVLGSPDSDCHILIGYYHNPAFATTEAVHPGKVSGITVEPRDGDIFAGVVLTGGGSVGGGDFEYFIFHSTDRDASNGTFAITGPEHASGGGLIWAGGGSSTNPSLSFYGQQTDGFYSAGASTIGWTINAVAKGFFGNGFRVGTPTGGDPGNDNMNIAGEIRQQGTKVVGARKTGWTVATGTAARTTFATYAAPDISASPTESEVQGIADHVQILSQRLKALIDDLHGTSGHGLIGT